MLILWNGISDMPKIKETTVFAYDELGEDAKERARAWYLEGYEPFDDPSFEDFERICEILGVTLRTAPVKLMGGGTRYDPVIYYSVSWSQGDGAAFEGSYSYTKGSVVKIKEYAPEDKELHRIAADLAEIQRRNFYQLYARIESGRYFNMSVDVCRQSSTYQEMSVDAEEAVTQAMRDLAHWLYVYLRTEYEWQTSEEQVAENIRCNEYEFTEEGRIA